MKDLSSAFSGALEEFQEKLNNLQKYCNSQVGLSVRTTSAATSVAAEILQ